MRERRVLGTAVVPGLGAFSVCPQLPVIACSLFVSPAHLWLLKDRERVYLSLVISTTYLDINEITFWFNKINE